MIHDAETLGHQVTAMVVRSPGGSVIEGMKIGEIIRDRALSVIVYDYCLSACANYFATAAEDLFVMDGAFVGFHGGARRSEHSLDKLFNLIPAPASAAPCNNSIASGRSAVSPDGAIFATVRGADAKERLYLYDLEKHSHRVVDFADAGVGEVEAICWMNDSELVASHRAGIPVRGLGERSDQGVAILKYSYLTREGKITTTVTAPPNADNGQYQLLRRQ